MTTCIRIHWRSRTTYGNALRSRRFFERRPCRHQLLRPPPRPCHPVLHRDVGALQLLRHARHPHLLPYGHHRQGRPRVHRFQSRSRLRTLHRDGLPDVPGRRLDCGPHSRTAPRGADWRHLHRVRRILSGGALGSGVLSRPHPAGHRHRAAQGQRVDHRRPVVHPGRSAPRFRLLPLLHGDQPRCTDFARHLRICRRAHQLEARLRGGSAGPHRAPSGDPEKDLREQKTAMRAIGIGLAVVAVLAALGMSGIVEPSANLISDGFGWCLLAISVVIFSYLIFFGNWSPVERKRCAAILVLFVSSSLFWAAYEQAGSSLSFFAERGTDCTVLGYAFPPSWYQSVQPVFVVLLAPVFAWIWLKMGRREPSSPAKFSLGLLFGGLAFAILVPAAYTVVCGSKVGPYWLTGTYLLQTLGELCLSPVGLSAMTKLAPARAAGFIMGIWFLTNSIGNWLAGKAASMYSSMPLPTLFGANAAFSIVAAIVLALLIKPTVRLMQGVK